jgi:aryl-alcohol dehydrogenase-like predicted oxidoreductase
MPLDHFVTLGRSGLRVSPFCLGGMTFGEERGWGSSAAVSEGIIDRYLDCGGNFIDTANSYNRGHSEKIIGDHVGCHPARRNRIAPAPAHCLYRSLLDALLGPVHADRRDDARA